MTEKKEVEITYPRLLDELSPEQLKQHEELAANILKEIFEVVDNKACRSLIVAGLNAYLHDFMVMTGSAAHHHNYIGGLKDHTMEVIRFAIAIAKQHNSVGFISNKRRIDMNILVTAAFFHDFGKLYAYQDAEPLKRPKGARPKKPFKRTYHTMKMNHFGEALWILQDLITPEMEMPKWLEREIFHCVASHHGEVRSAWGDSSSMLNPSSNEAWILFLADMASAKLE